MPSSVMQEIWEVRQKIYGQTKEMSIEERIRFFEEGNQRFQASAALLKETEPKPADDYSYNASKNHFY